MDRAAVVPHGDAADGPFPADVVVVGGVDVVVEEGEESVCLGGKVSYEGWGVEGGGE